VVPVSLSYIFRKLNETAYTVKNIVAANS